MLLDLRQSWGDVQVSRQWGVAEAAAQPRVLHEGGVDWELGQLWSQPCMGLCFRGGGREHGVIRRHGHVDSARQRLLGLLSELKVSLGWALEQRNHIGKKKLLQPTLGRTIYVLLLHYYCYTCVGARLSICMGEMGYMLCSTAVPVPYRTGESVGRVVEDTVL